MKISEAFDYYRDHYMIIKFQSRRMVETHEHVKSTLISAVGDKAIEDFSLDDLSKWNSLMSRGRCQNTMRNDLTRVRSVLRYLQLCEIKTLNPELVVIPRRIDTQIEFLSPSEVEQMIRCTASLRNKFVISLLYSSGIRLSEMIALNRGQIRERRFTVIGKGGKARLCFIDQRTEDFMEEYLRLRNDASSALIVSNIYKQRLTASNVQLLIKNSAQRAGIARHITPHTLRHSFATNFLQNGGDCRYLQRLLGHSSLNTTMKYAHVSDVDLEEKYAIFHSIS